MFQEHRPDLTLMDFRLPGIDGTATLVEIRKVFLEARIIMLTTSDSEGDIQRAMRAGAAAYVLKSMPKEDILGIIRSVHQRGRFMPTQVAALIAEHLGDEQLTVREPDVLRLIRDGYRNKQIADQLCIAETTVNFHIKNIVDKLHANRSHPCSDHCGATRFARIVSKQELQKSAGLELLFYVQCLCADSFTVSVQQRKAG